MTAEVILQGFLIGMSTVFGAGAMGLALGNILFAPKPGANVADKKRGKISDADRIAR